MKNINKILLLTIFCLGLMVPFQVWAQKYTVKAVGNGGSIKGTINYSGKAPAPKLLTVDKDKQVCDSHPKYSEELLVNGKNGGIKNVVVAIKNISSGKDWDLPEAGLAMEQKGCWFYPHVLIVPAGVTFYVTNNDGILHNIHTHSTKNKIVNKAQPKFVKKLRMKFDLAENISISCDVHSWMKGWVAVADHPYYAVTDENGSFDISQVPPGTYSIELWHETLGSQTKEITVAAGADAKVDAVFGSKE